MHLARLVSMIISASCYTIHELWAKLTVSLLSVFLHDCDIAQHGTIFTPWLHRPGRGSEWAGENPASQTLYLSYRQSCGSRSEQINNFVPNSNPHHCLTPGCGPSPGTIYYLTVSGPGTINFLNIPYYLTSSSKYKTVF
jgi:hypothetical protein